MTKRLGVLLYPGALAECLALHSVPSNVGDGRVPEAGQIAPDDVEAELRPRRRGVSDAHVPAEGDIEQADRHEATVSHDVAARPVEARVAVNHRQGHFDLICAFGGEVALDNSEAAELALGKEIGPLADSDVAVDNGTAQKAGRPRGHRQVA